MSAETPPDHIDIAKLRRIHDADNCTVAAAMISAHNALPALLDRIEALEAENTVLRGLVQCNPDWRCPYGQSVSHIAECPHGFPGCACADDRLAIMMGGGEAKG